MIIKSMYTLGGNVPLKILVEAMCDIEKRPEWDKKVLSARVLNEYSKHLAVYHTVVYFPWIQNRDFVEKRLVFEHGDTVYFYYSSIDDSFCPISKEFTRGYTIFSVNKMRKVGDTIFVHTCTQKNIQIPLSSLVTPSSVGSRAATGMEEFRAQLIGRIEQVLKDKGNHK